MEAKWKSKKCLQNSQFWKPGLPKCETTVLVSCNFWKI
jgi:hypothetical protein